MKFKGVLKYILLLFILIIPNSVNAISCTIDPITMIITLADGTEYQAFCLLQGGAVPTGPQDCGFIDAKTSKVLDIITNKFGYDNNATKLALRLLNAAGVLDGELFKMSPTNYTYQHLISAFESYQFPVTENGETVYKCGNEAIPEFVNYIKNLASQSKAPSSKHDAILYNAAKRVYTYYPENTWVKVLELYAQEKSTILNMRATFEEAGSASVKPLGMEKIKDEEYILDLLAGEEDAGGQFVVTNSNNTCEEGSVTFSLTAGTISGTPEVNVSGSCSKGNVQVSGYSVTVDYTFTSKANCGCTIDVTADVSGSGANNVTPIPGGGSGKGGKYIYMITGGASQPFIGTGKGKKVPGKATGTYTADCECKEDECPPKAPQKPVSASNCCEDGDQVMKEDELDDLFCPDKTLGVKYYKVHAGMEYYLDEYANKKLEVYPEKTEEKAKEYCQIYCVEDVTIKMPSPITATSGRSFKLKEAAWGTTSAYSESNKKCRTIIKFDKWEEIYYNKVEDEVENYNKYMEATAAAQIFTKDTSSGPDDGTPGGMHEKQEKYPVEVEVTYDCKSKTAPFDYTVKDQKSTDSEEVDYTEYTFPNGTRKFYSVNVNEVKRNVGAKKYDEILIESDKNKYNASLSLGSDCFKESNTNNTFTVSHENKKTITPDDKSKIETTYNKILNRIKVEIQKAHPTEDCTMTPNELDFDNYCITDVPGIQSKLEGIRTSSKQAYNDAKKKAKELEKVLEVCDHYYDNGIYSPIEGSPIDFDGAPQEAYKVDTTMKFSYLQTYLNQEMQCITDQQYIGYEPGPSGANSEHKNCIIEGPLEVKPGVDFSTEVYKNGDEIGTDFAGEIAYSSKRNPYKDFLDKPFIANKTFAQDAKYNSICYNKEKDSESKTQYPYGNTLVPNMATYDSTTTNVTIHNREYNIYTATVSGTYETFWELSGVGEKPVFDEAIKNGETCSGYTGGSVSGYIDNECKLGKSYGDGSSGSVGVGETVDTCTFTIVAQLVETGKCNPICPYRGVVPNTEGYNFFNFKIADPKNVFPTCNGYKENSECNYAYNWLATETGKKVKDEIEKHATDTTKNGGTYNPEHLTYSFRLTVNDMKAIKEYNASVKDGYNDFDLDCKSAEADCEQEGGDDVTCKSNHPLTGCKSKFIASLVNGNLTVGTKSYKVTKATRK